MRNLESLQIRVPLSLVLVTLSTFLFVSVAIGLLTSLNLQADQKRSLTAQAFALAPILTEALLHDDVWTAYTVLHGPTGTQRPADRDAPFHLVIDEDGKVFVSDRPQRFPLGLRLESSDEGKDIIRALPGTAPSSPRFLDLGGRLIIYTPLLSEDAPVGSLFIAGPRDAVKQKLLGILGGGLAVMIGLLLIITPIGWLWGSRMVKPLVKLSECMRRVGKAPVEALHCPTYAGQDEIGQLTRGFQTMLGELREKQALERQMVAQDRLAAIGRIAGGVAHEINNPLAGMLVAIDTHKQKPPEQQDLAKTLALVERGLDQIKDTVSALLVECRVEQRRCTPDDIEDIRRLILTDKGTRRVEVHWNSDIREDLPLPATAIRQILLNLTLNAIQAAGESDNGRAEVRIFSNGQQLGMEIRNNGVPTPQADLERIFEPFLTGRTGGTGLGLWITYQIVEQLQGEIIAMSDDDQTLFRITLPFPSPETDPPT